MLLLLETSRPNRHRRWDALAGEAVEPRLRHQPANVVIVMDVARVSRREPGPLRHAFTIIRFRPSYW